MDHSVQCVCVCVYYKAHAPSARTVCVVVVKYVRWVTGVSHTCHACTLLAGTFNSFCHVRFGPDSGQLCVREGFLAAAAVGHHMLEAGNKALTRNYVSLQKQ